MSLNGLVTKKVESISVYMMLKIGMEVDQYGTVFNYRPPIPQKYLKFQYRTIVAGLGVKLAPIFSLSGNSEEKFGK